MIGISNRHTRDERKQAVALLTCHGLLWEEVSDQIVRQYTNIATKMVINHQTGGDGSPVALTSSASPTSSPLLGLVGRLGVLLEIHDRAVADCKWKFSWLTTWNVQQNSAVHDPPS